MTLWAGKFPSGNFTLENLLTFACTGFVSGYIAIRLLPAIADKFLKELVEKTEVLDKRTDALDKKTEDLDRKTDQGIENAVRLATELTRAIDYLTGKSFADMDTQRLIASLTSLV
ncbi:MAG: hypothetical protein ABR976_02935 [Terracidiphilus sp.]